MSLSFFKEEKISLKFSTHDLKSISKSLKNLSISNSAVVNQQNFVVKNMDYRQIQIKFSRNFSTNKILLKTQFDDFIENGVAESAFNLDKNKVNKILYSFNFFLIFRIQI